jgi:hypothetical protein
MAGDYFIRLITFVQASADCVEKVVVAGGVKS